MKRIAIYVGVISVVGVGFACSMRSTPRAEVGAPAAALESADGPVREIVFEPDVIVAHEDDGEPSSSSM